MSSTLNNLLHKKNDFSSEKTLNCKNYRVPALCTINSPYSHEIYPILETNEEKKGDCTNKCVYTSHGSNRIYSGFSFKPIVEGELNINQQTFLFSFLSFSLWRSYPVKVFPQQQDSDPKSFHIRKILSSINDCLFSWEISSGQIKPVEYSLRVIFFVES